MLPGVWFTRGENLGDTPPDAPFAIAEDEGPSDRAGIRSELPTLPEGPRYGVITDCWVYKDTAGVTDVLRSRESTRAIVQAGFACLTELYLRTDSGQPTGKTAESLEFVAREHLGYTDVQPCFGVFGGAQVSDYRQWSDLPATSIYLAEAIL